MVKNMKLHFSGPVLTASGYGVHARQVLLSLYESGKFDIAVDPKKWGETPTLLNDKEVKWILPLIKNHEKPDISVQVTIPNEFKRLAPITIGITAGIEVDRVSPSWLVACNNEVDAVIVPSQHSKNSFLIEYQGKNGEHLKLEKPIFVINEYVDTAKYFNRDVLFNSVESKSKYLDKLNVPKKNFIFTGLAFDKPNGEDRKNATKLVEYFCKSFSKNDDVGLILKASIVNNSIADFRVLEKKIKEIKNSLNSTAKIYLLHGRLTDDEMAEIYNDNRVISAISITHGEGFGLPLIEAAACALPVMATDWSGHLDFLSINNEKFFIPFSYKLGEIGRNSVWDGVLDAGSRWAFVDENDVINKMKKMVVDSSTPKNKANVLSYHIKNEFSKDKFDKVFIGFFDKIISEFNSEKVCLQIGNIEKLKQSIKNNGKKNLIYTMPMSAGDVFLSTAIISSLRMKHDDCNFYFATSKKYFDILKDLKFKDQNLIDNLIEWAPWMQVPSSLERCFDYVYTPNMNVQMQWANWVQGGTGKNIVEEFASHCNVEHGSVVYPEIDYDKILANKRERKKNVICIHTGGQKSARLWSGWSVLVKNLRNNGFNITQIGELSDLDVGEVDIDLRGKTNHKELCETILLSDLFIGIDSYPMHVASCLNASYKTVEGIPVISIFGSSYVKSTGPLLSKRKSLFKLIETENRNGCERACYKDICSVDQSNPCINNIKSETVYENAKKLLSHIKFKDFVDYRPKISGYTHILNPKKQNYPFIQSILSMMGFCDEVVVVDGGSTDGSIELLNESVEAFKKENKENKCQVNVVVREWDYEEPGMDGMQKAFGRAMVSADADFLWQQDADEVVHENDYEKIHDICRRFPKDVDVVHLPIIELWGDSNHARTDRHSWKWRLSRNNIRITHGINIHARLIDKESGRTYAKQGMSDGCELIDMVSGDHLPHKGFYTKELDNTRQTNPEEYGNIMNDVFTKLPSVWHYSWCDLERKILNFKSFWDGQWNSLYNSKNVERFPNVKTEDDLKAEVKKLLDQGGEHFKSKTFKLKILQPKIMVI